MEFTEWVGGYLVEFRQKHILRTQESESEARVTYSFNWNPWFVIWPSFMSNYFFFAVGTGSLCFNMHHIKLAQSNVSSQLQLFCSIPNSWERLTWHGLVVYLWQSALAKEAGSHRPTWPPLQQGLSFGWLPSCFLLISWFYKASLIWGV